MGVYLTHCGRSLFGSRGEDGWALGALLARASASINVLGHDCRGYELRADHPSARGNSLGLLRGHFSDRSLSAPENASGRQDANRSMSFYKNHAIAANACRKRSALAGVRYATSAHPRYCWNLPMSKKKISCDHCQDTKTAHTVRICGDGELWSKIRCPMCQPRKDSTPEQKTRKDRYG